MNDPRNAYLSLAILCFVLALLLALLLISAATAHASPQQLPPAPAPAYGYCLAAPGPMLSGSLCVWVPNWVGRGIDCRWFGSCRPRVGG